MTVRLSAQTAVVGEALRTIRPYPGLVALVVLGSLALGALDGASLWLLLPLLRSLDAADPASITRLQRMLLLVGGLVLVRAGASYLHATLSARLRLRMLIDVREKLVRTLYRVRVDEIRALGDGKVVNLLSGQAERLVEATGSLTTLLNALVLALVYAGALLLLSWPVALGAAALAAASVALTRKVSRKVAEAASGMIEAEEISAGLVVDDVAGLHVIQAFDAGAQRLARHTAVNRTLFHEAMTLHRWRAALGPLSQGLYVVAIVGGLLGVLAVWGESVAGTLPLMVTVVVVLHRLQAQLAAGSDAWTALSEQETPAANLHALMREVVTEAREEIPPPPSIGEIGISRLSFSYRPGQPVIDDLDLDLRRGRITALVGASGSGKSTLAHLLVRLRTPGAGRVMLDGVALSYVTRRALAQKVGIVFQDAFLFDDSVLWNVSLGRDLAPVALAEAMRVAGLDDLVGLLPRGTSTRVGPRGAVLSGGQRQRVALARALAGVPDLLILDEATAALDAEAERMVLDAVRALRRERITLVIAHRLSTVLAADRIAVLDRGRVVAEGRHDDLLQSSEPYRRLVETQIAALV